MKQMSRLSGVLLAVVAALIIVAPAHAQIFNFVWWENPGDTPTQLATQMEVVEGSAGQFGLRFTNNSSIASIITDIYIEGTTGTASDVILSSWQLTVESTGVDFENGTGSSPNPDGISPWNGTFDQWSAVPPPADNGINETGGEFFTVYYDGSASSVASALEAGTFNVAMHVQGIDENIFPDGSIWLINDGSEPIPLPASVWLFGSGLVGLIGRRAAKRKKS